MQMVGLKKKTTQKTHQTISPTPPKKNQASRVCSALKINWLSVWNTEHATLLKQNSPQKCLDL